MQRHNRFQLHWLGLLTSLTVSSLALPTAAQITPDATLGNGNNSVLIINGNRIEITGGLQRNSALFQSFDQFNVNSNQQVYFLNPAGVTNIFSRVTGGSLSNIDGLLGVAGSANLFLMNPSGIVFGPNARLDIAGSFFATTANALEFPDGQKFAATGNREVPLVEVNIPVGLQFGATPPAMLNSQGNLAVGPGQSLTLAGGTTTVSGSLTAAGGKVEVLGQQVNLIDQAKIDVSSPTGGGTVLVGGDYQGQGGLLNSAQTYVGPDVLINANATIDGNGGKVIVWSDGATGFYGNISSRGGAIAGNGGFVETSGKQYLAALGKVDTTAVNGVAGTWLLDPFDIEIVDTAPSAPGIIVLTPSGSAPATFTATGSISYITTANLNAALALNNVTISTGSTVPGSGPGSIKVGGSGISPTIAGTNTARTLTLSATGGSISVNSSIGVSSANPATNSLTVAFNAATTTVDAAINTNGGSITFNSSSTTSVNSPLNTNGGSVDFIGASATTLNSTINTNGGTVSGNSTTVDVQQGGSIQNGIDIAANSGATVNVAASTGSNSYAGVNFSKNVSLAFASGGVDITGGLTTTGPFSLSGVLTTTGAQSYEAVTLVGNTVLNSTNNNITFNNTVNSAASSNHNLTVNAGTSDVDFDDLGTGASGAIGNLQITGRDVTLAATNISGDLNISSTGAITGPTTGNSSVIVGGTTTLSASNDITLDQAGNNFANTVQINNARDVTLRNVGNLTLSVNNARDVTLRNVGNLTLGLVNTSAINLNVSTSGVLQLQNSIRAKNFGTITLSGSTVNANLDLANSIQALAGTVNILATNTINLNSGTIDVSGVLDSIKPSGGTVQLGGSLTGSSLSSNSIEITANGISPVFKILATGAGNARQGEVFIYADNINAATLEPNLLARGVTIDGITQLNNSNFDYSILFNDITVLDGSSFTVGTRTVTDLDINQYNHLFITQSFLQLLTGFPNTALRAARSFTINSLTSGTLAMQTFSQFSVGSTSGSSVPLDPSVSYTSPTFVMDSANTITTGGRDFTISVGQLNAPVPNLFASLIVGSINTTGSTPSAPPSGSLTLSSEGNLVVNGSLTTNAPSPKGDIQIKAIGSVTITGNNTVISTGGGNVTVESVKQGNLNITSNINTSLTGNRGGDITFRAENGYINLTNTKIFSINSSNNPNNLNNFSRIRIEAKAGNTGSNPINVGPNPGDVILNGTTIKAANPSNSTNTVANPISLAGDVFINGSRNIEITNSTIDTDGNTGQIIIGSSDPTGTSPLAPNKVTITGSKLTTTNAAVVDGNVPSGQIIIRANNNLTQPSIKLENSTLSTSTVGSGTGGSVKLRSNSISLTNVSVNAGTSGSGQGGSIEVEAGPPGTFANSVTLNSSRLNAQTNGSGAGGTIVVNAQIINLNNNSELNAEVQASGDGGVISVSTPSSGTLTLNNSRISTAVTPLNPLLATGTGNSINVNVGALALQSGARIQSQTNGSGDAGDITLNVQSSLTISGRNQARRFSGVLASSDSSSSGAGGQITVNASNLTLSDNGFLAANTSSSKDGGNIDINVQTLDVQSGGQILTAALPGSAGAAGRITINATQGVTLSGAVPPVIQPPSPFIGLSLIDLANISNQTVSQPSGGGIAYYAFNVAAAGSTGTFDIDGGYKISPGGIPTSSSIDTQIFLFDRTTGSLLATNDDSTVDPGSIAVFSTLTRDSFLNYTFLEAGAYVLGVGAYPSYANAGLAPIVPFVGNGPTAAQTYTLNVNLSQPGVGPAVSSRLNPNLPLNTSSNSLFASGLYASSQGSGNAGSVTVKTPTLNLSNQATIAATTTNAGSTGDNITLNGLNNLTMNGGSQITASTGAGTAGNIIVNANQGINSSVNLSDSTITAVATDLGGRAGGVTIATPTVTLNNATITASNNGPNTVGGGTSRDITFQGLNALTLSNNSQISASTGSGTAGNVTVNAVQGVSLSGNSEISAEATAGGNAGGVSITTPNLSLTNSSAVQVSSLRGGGTAGGIAIAANTVTLTNNSSIDAKTDAGGATRPANVSLTGLQTLSLNSSSISSATNSGTAGNVGINASSGINLANNSSVAAEAISGGNAGSVSMTTPTLNVNNSSILVSSLNGAGTAGDITIAANTVNLLNNAEIAAETDAGGASSPANVFLNGLQTLNVDNSVISSATNQGTAGNLSVSAANQINLNNNSRLSVAATGPGGTAGSLNLSTFNMQVNQSDVTVSSALGVAGELTVKANRLTLNQGRLLAEIGQNSANSKAGTITLSVDFRMDLENESLISTLGSNGANGGDISILNVRFLLGKRATGADGSDIIGRADGGGRGGRVLLDRSILVSGFLFRRATPGNRTNDIDTNGQLANFSTDADQGTRGLSAPVLVFSDVSELVTGACEAVGAKTAASNSGLQIAGRGGVPSSPTAPLSAQPSTSDWVSLELMPQVPVGVTFSDGSTVVMNPGETYELQSTCANAWKLQQQSNF